MKVSGVGPTTSTDKARRKDKASARPGEFARHLESAATESEGGAPTEGAAPAAAVGGLLAVQAMSDAPDREARRRQVQRGERILDKLDALRIGLLEGRVPEATMVELAQTVRQRRESLGDPRLEAVLDEIQLRAEVELAKLSRRGG